MTMNGGMSEVSSMFRTMGTSNKNTNFDEIQDLSLIPLHEMKLTNLHESEVSKDNWTNRIKQRLHVKAIRCTCLGFNLPTVGASFPAMRTAMDSTSSWQKSAVRSFKVQEHPIWSYHQSKQIFLDIFTMNCEVEIQWCCRHQLVPQVLFSKKQIRYLWPVRMVSRQ